MSDRVPVLFVHSPTRPPLGADTWIHALIMRSLDRSRFRVHVACPRGHKGAPTPIFQALSRISDLELKSVNLGPELFALSKFEKVRAALDGGLPALWSLADLALYIRKRGIRILHTSDRPRDAVACALLARLTGTKYIVHVHVAYGNWMSPMLRRSMARADALIGVSSFVARTLVDAGYARSRTHAVLNAIDAAAWDPGQGGAGVRAELGIPMSAPVITCVARIYPGKGHAELLRALSIVRRDTPDVRLLVVGQDYPEGAGHAAAASRLAHELGVEKNVTFVGQRKDIARVLAATDVYAMASVREPFGLAYAEAMAMKRPVVALDDGGTPEVVEHGKSGLLSAEGDVAAFASHLSKLIRDPELRSRMGAYGRQVVETKFTPERMARDVADVYSSL